jgi:hypothetical protein
MRRIGSQERLTAYLQPQDGVGVLVADLVATPPLTVGLAIGHLDEHGAPCATAVGRAVLDRLRDQTPNDAQMWVGTVRRGKRIVYGVRNILRCARPGDTVGFLLPNEAQYYAALRQIDLRPPATEGGD